MNLRHNLFQLAIVATLLAFTSACTTTYDAYGRPVQSVDPALALAGIAAAGVVGYAIAENNNDDRRYYSKRYRRDYDRCNRCGGYHPGSRCRTGHYYY